MNIFKNSVRRFLPFAVVISAFCALAYATVQQAYRQGANDPQIQMANDTVEALENGQEMESLLPTDLVAVGKSLAPFLIFYDAQGEVLAASVTLDGKTPELPEGVLEATRQMGGENRRTWQPREGVRIAAVIVSYPEGYVLAGRNLREVEAREAQTTTYAGLTWLLAMSATLAVIVFGELMLRGKT